MPDTKLHPDLSERVLAKIGLPRPPVANADGLARLYEAFSCAVPFDNVRKRIYLARGGSGPLPGDDPAEFLEGWVRDGTGGTCWAISGGFHALLRSLDFRASRVLSTMLVGPADAPPNHGSVTVELEEGNFLVDPTMKLHKPLRLSAEPTSVAHDARGAECQPMGPGWTVSFSPLHLDQPLRCRLDRLDATAADCRSRHEDTRGWSPFNYQVYARVARPDRSEAITFGSRVLLENDGTMTRDPADEKMRKAFLIEEVGMSEEIVSQLPADEKTPPPPGSKTAAENRA
ncbi:MAG: arylamine N-acetyltransferase [bacterium]|nr:arylamine N-acetyltransferase [bacterium]